jgi:hypothetical protein
MNFSSGHSSWRSQMLDPLRWLATGWLIRPAARFQLEWFGRRIGAHAMAISREQARTEHTASTSHDQFSETIYGVVCSTCHNYILIDKTNCPPSCREHETCRAAYA